MLGLRFRFKEVAYVLELVPDIVDRKLVTAKFKDYERKSNDRYGNAL